MPIIPALSGIGLNAMFVYGADGLNSQYTINGANLRFAAAFRSPETNDSCTGFRFSCDGVFGTVTNIAVAELYAVDATTGYPTGSVLATATFTPANGMNVVTWASAYSTTASTIYAIVMKNVDGTPGTNYYRPRYGFNRNSGALKRLVISNDAGTSWNVISGSGTLVPALAPNFATAGYYSELCTPDNGSGGNGLAIYNTSGSRVARSATKFVFTVPVKIFGVSLGFSKANSPTFDLKAEICTASAVVATSTNTWNAADAVPSAFFGFDGVELSADTEYYVCVTPVDASAGDSSNNVKLYVFSTTTSALALPFTHGPFRQSYESTASPGPSWSANTNWYYSMYLHIGLPEPASGGGLLTHPGMAGGLNG